MSPVMQLCVMLIEDASQQVACIRTRCSSLMMSLTEAIHQQSMTQAQAATLFGVTQPHLSEGKVNLFSLDALMDMAAAAGMTPTIHASKPKVVPARRAPRKAPAHA